MKNQNTTLSIKDNDKGKTFIAQKEIVYKAFYKKPSTMYEVSIQTGIIRANICRFVGDWKKSNAIQIVRKGICPISKRDEVQILTTNPDLFSKLKIQTLFDYEKK